METEKRYGMLEGISQCVPANGAGEDEDNLLQNFLPLRGYSRLADSFFKEKDLCVFLVSPQQPLYESEGEDFSAN